jgi:hypothetical protein
MIESLSDQKKFKRGTLKRKRKREDENIVQSNIGIRVKHYDETLDL